MTEILQIKNCIIINEENIHRSESAKTWWY